MLYDRRASNEEIAPIFQKIGSLQYPSVHCQTDHITNLLRTLRCHRMYALGSLVIEVSCDQRDRLGRQAASEDLSSICSWHVVYLLVSLFITLIRFSTLKKVEDLLCHFTNYATCDFR